MENFNYGEMIEWDVFEFIIVGLLALVGFFVRLIFARLDGNARMLTKLTASQAATHEQIVSLFRSLDKLEGTVDELVKSNR